MAVGAAGCGETPDLSGYTFACEQGGPCPEDDGVGPEDTWTAPEVADAVDAVEVADVPDAIDEVDVADVADAGSELPDVVDAEVGAEVDAAPDLPEAEVAEEVAEDAGPDVPEVGLEVLEEVAPEVVDEVEVEVEVVEDTGPDLPPDPCLELDECATEGVWQCIQEGNALQQCQVDADTGCLVAVTIESCVDENPCTDDLCIPAQQACAFPPADEGLACPGGQCHAGVCDVFLAIDGLDGGATQSCARRTDNTVWCWGRQTGGIGDGSPTSTVPAPVQVQGLDEPVAGVAVGAAHACAWSFTGEAWCWGAGANGRLGYGGVANKSIATAVEGLSGVVQVAPGGEHTCALDGDGAVWCWGGNDEGQVGAGAADGGDKLGPLQVPGIEGATAIASGAAHTCVAAGEPAAVTCWGANDHGQLDAPDVDVTILGAGDRSTCAIAGSSSSVWCWGALGSFVPDSAPLVDGSGTVVEGVTGLAVGAEHLCVRTTSGGVACLGDNASSQLGDGTLASSESFVALDLPFGPAEALGAGGAHTCASDETGAAWCWGSSRTGQLGHGVAGPDSPDPVVPDLDWVVDTLSAGDDHVCASAGDATACWGAGAAGQLGDGAGELWPAPVAVAAAAGLVAAGGDRSCGQVDGTTTHCWGAGVLEPEAQAGAPAVVELATADTWTCGRTSTGAVHCWGAPAWGDDVVELDGLPDKAVGLTAGADHACATLLDGSLHCWGEGGSGQLGVGATDAGWQAPAAAAIPGVARAAAGDAHTCAVTETQGTWCWGEGSRGELGNGAFTDSPLPVQVATELPLGLLAAGRDHTCAEASQDVVCWGGDDAGEVGPGATGDTGTPVSIGGYAGGLQLLAAGGDVTCVSGPEGLACWGSNASGQLGDGSLLSKDPVAVLGLP